MKRALRRLRGRLKRLKRAVARRAVWRFHEHEDRITLEQQNDVAPPEEFPREG